MIFVIFMKFTLRVDFCIFICIFFGKNFTFEFSHLESITSVLIFGYEKTPTKKFPVPKINLCIYHIQRKTQRIFISHKLWVIILSKSSIFTLKIKNFKILGIQPNHKYFLKLFLINGRTFVRAFVNSFLV